MGMVPFVGMDKSDPQNKSRISFLNEILLSLNLGFGVSYALFSYVGDSYFPSYAPRSIQIALESFGRLLLRIAPLIVSEPASVRRRSAVIWEVGFVVVMGVIALFTMGLRRILIRANLRQHMLDSFAGFTALVAVPGCWFYMIEITRPGSMRQTFWSTYGTLFVLEIVVSGVLLYLYRHRSLWWGSLLFIFHYAFWLCVMGRISGAPSITALILSPIFPLSGVIWLRYAKAQHALPIYA